MVSGLGDLVWDQTMILGAINIFPNAYPFLVFAPLDTQSPSATGKPKHFCDGTRQLWSLHQRVRER
jgi:hypothetical protein